MNVRKLPSGTYEARLIVNGVRYTATLPTLEDAQDWITVVRAKAVTGGLPRRITVQQYQGPPSPPNATPRQARIRVSVVGLHAAGMIRRPAEGGGHDSHGYPVGVGMKVPVGRHWLERYDGQEGRALRTAAVQRAARSSPNVRASHRPLAPPSSPRT